MLLATLFHCSVQFSHSVVSDSLQPHELQHAKPPCPTPTPGVHPNSCPSSRWHHLNVVPFSSCPQSLLASESFPINQLFAWGGQSIAVSFSINPSKEHPGLISFRMDWLDLLADQGTLKSLLQHHSSKASILQLLRMACNFELMNCYFRNVPLDIFQHGWLQGNWNCRKQKD